MRPTPDSKPFSLHVASLGRLLLIKSSEGNEMTWCSEDELRDYFVFNSFTIENMSTSFDTVGNENFF